MPSKVFRQPVGACITDPSAGRRYALAGIATELPGLWHVRARHQGNFRHGSAGDWGKFAGGGNRPTISAVVQRRVIHRGFHGSPSQPSCSRTFTGADLGSGWQRVAIHTNGAGAEHQQPGRCAAGHAPHHESGGIAARPARPAKSGVSGGVDGQGGIAAARAGRYSEHCVRALHLGREFGAVQRAGGKRVILHAWR